MLCRSALVSGGRAGGSGPTGTGRGWANVSIHNIRALHGAHIYLRVLVVGQPGVQVGDAGVEKGVPRDEGGLGCAGLLLVGRGRKGSFEIPLGECAAPEKGVLKHDLAESR